MDPQQFWQTGNSAAPSAPAQENAPDPGGYQADAAAAPAQGNAPDQQPGESTVDYEARARQLEADLQAAQAERDRLSGTMQQVQQWAEVTSAQQQEQAFQNSIAQHRQSIYQQAETMNPSDAYRHIQNEESRIQNALIERARQIQQQSQQQIQQVQRQAATPLWIDHLAKTNGLSEAAKQELIALGDPDMAARLAPALKQRYSQIDNLQQQLNQLSRSRQAGNLQQAGLGMVGGSGVSNAPTGLSDDPDVRAMQIYQQLKQGTYQPS